MVAIRENWGKKKMSPGHDFLACCHVGQLGIRTLRELKIEQASVTDDSDYAFLPIGPFSGGEGVCTTWKREATSKQRCTSEVGTKLFLIANELS